MLPATGQNHAQDVSPHLVDMESTSASDAAGTDVSNLPDLPDPQLNLSQEIEFRRLLQACQSQIQSQSTNSDTAGPGPGSEAGVDLQAAKLKHYIESLQEQLDELERSHALEQHVAALVAKTPKVTLPPFCQKPKPPAAPLPALSSASTSQPPGPPKGPGYSSNGGRASADQPGFSGTLSEAAKKKLQREEELHESLTDRLGDLVGAVKENALAAQAKVEQRGALVDAADKALAQNLDKARDVVGKTKQQFKRGGSTFCLTLWVLLLVGLVFSGMLVYIKLTHLIGYRASRATRLADEL